MREEDKYKQAYQLMMMFWDDINEENRKYLDEKLKELGL